MPQPIFVSPRAAASRVTRLARLLRLLSVLLPAAALAAPPAAVPPAPRPGPAAAGAAIAPALPPMTSPAAFCAEAVKRLPNLTPMLCQRAGLIDGGGRSVRQQPLWVRDVLPPDAKYRVLVIGGIHGDEPSSSSLVMHWIQQAVATPAEIHWRFVPMANPDGLLQARPTRANANGVDLNRNFPTPNWDKEAIDYWKRRTNRDPRRWPGAKALSEPETRWVHDEMERFKPHLIVSVHAPYGILDFDGPSVPPQRLGRLYLDQIGIFPGSLGNWGGLHKKVPVVTIELPSAVRTPLDAETRQMWLDLLRWMSERLPQPPAA